MVFTYDTTTAPGKCGTQESRSLGTQITYGLGISGAVVPQKFELLAEVYGYADVTGSAATNLRQWLRGTRVRGGISPVDPDPSTIGGV